MADLITQTELTNAVPALSGSADLAALIAAASAAIEKHCKRPLALQAKTDTFTLDFPTASVFLKLTPVAAITSVTLNGEVLDNTDGTAYTLTPETGELVRGWGQYRLAWPRGLRRLVVAYSGGYDPIPADLKRACVMHCLDLTHAAGLIQSEKIGDYQYTLSPRHAAGVSPYVAALLEAYRRPYVTSGG
jgi:hypothetical protein